MHLDNTDWRINNLYHIYDIGMQDVVFRPNEKQIRLIKTAASRNVIAKDHRMGASMAIWIAMLDACLLSCGETAVVLIPHQMAADCIFNNVFRYAYDCLPEDIKEKVRATLYKNSIAFGNGSVLQVATELRGINPTILHIPEAEKGYDPRTLDALPDNAVVFIEAEEAPPELDGYTLIDFRGGYRETK